MVFFNSHAQVGSKESILTYLSETYLHNDHLLFHEFEVLHNGLFYSTVGFFAACATIIYQLNQQFREWDYERRHDYLKFRYAFLGSLLPVLHSMRSA